MIEDLGLFKVDATEAEAVLRMDARTLSILTRLVDRAQPNSNDDKARFQHSKEMTLGGLKAARHMMERAGGQKR